MRVRPAELVGWLVRHPLLVCLPAQAGLLFFDLGRLPVWGDEQASLDRSALPLGELVRALGANVHPPLYFLLLKLWLGLPWAADRIVRARTLSGLFLLVATVVVDACWLRGLDTRRRAWFLALWTLSPALLLYGRIARSYTLQLLLASVTLYAGRRYTRRFSLLALLAYAGAASVLLYTHYLPGISVVAAVALAELWQVMRERDGWRLLRVAAPFVVIAVVFVAWSSRFTAAVVRVIGTTPYRTNGNAWVDAVAALGFAFVSLTFGETLWSWMIAVVVVLAPAVIVLLARGARQAPDWLAYVLLAALIGFVGARHWVSFAFVAARLLFLLPFYLLLLVQGSRRWERAGMAVFAAMLAVYAGAIGAYFDQAGFLNKAYVIPSAEISRIIRQRGADASVVILDHHSTSLRAVARDLPPGTRTILLADRQSADDAVRLAARNDVAVVWFARSAHDSSPEHWSDQVEAAFASRFSVHRTGFVPYSGFDRFMMTVAGWPTRPTHVIELLEMRAVAPAPPG